MFQMLGVFAEFERAMIQERVKAGLARAKAEGRTLGRPLGSRSADPKKIAKARKLLGDGVGILRAAKLSGLGTGTVQSLRASQTGHEIG
jgi:DNA invertase Pin-like site-specific DNA recombinase